MSNTHRTSHFCLLQATGNGIAGVKIWPALIPIQNAMNFLGFGQKIDPRITPRSLSRPVERAVISKNVDLGENTIRQRFDPSHDNNIPIGLLQGAVYWVPIPFRGRRGSHPKGEVPLGNFPESKLQADIHFKKLCVSFDDLLDFIYLICHDQAKMNYDMAEQMHFAMAEFQNAIQRDPSVANKEVEQKALPNEFIKNRTRGDLTRMNAMQRCDFIEKLLVRDLSKDIDEALKPLVYLAVERRNDSVRRRFESGLPERSLKEMSQILIHSESPAVELLRFLKREWLPIKYIYLIKDAVADYALGIDLDVKSLVLDKVKSYYISLKQFYRNDVFERYRQLSVREEIGRWARDRLAYLEADLFIKMVSQTDFVSRLSDLPSLNSHGLYEVPLEQIGKTAIIADLIKLLRADLDLEEIMQTIRIIDVKCNHLINELKFLDFDVVHYLVRYQSSITNMLVRSSIIKQMLALLNPSHSFEIISRFRYEKLLLLASAPFCFQNGHDMISSSDLERVKLQISFQLGRLEIKTKSGNNEVEMIEGLEAILSNLREAVKANVFYLLSEIVDGQYLRNFESVGSNYKEFPAFLNEVILSKKEICRSIRDLAIFMNTSKIIMNAQTRFSERILEQEAFDIRDVSRELINPVLNDYIEDTRSLSARSPIVLWFRLHFPTFLRSAEKMGIELNDSRGIAVPWEG